MGDDEEIIGVTRADLTAIIRTVLREARSPNGDNATRQEVSVNNATINSLMNRMSTFTYDPQNGLTFDLWFSRYDDTINIDGVNLDDAAKVRLLTQKLDQLAFQKYAAHILPKKFSECNFAETVKVLKALFGHQGSIFARRYQFLQTRCQDSNNGSFDDYTGVVNRRFEMAEMSKVDADQMKCLIWIGGLKEGQHDKIRQAALQFIEQKQNATLQELHQFAKNLTRLQATSRDIAAGSSREVSQVGGHNKSQPTTSTPNPCKGCGNLHFRLQCPFKQYTCKVCGKIGHKEALCYSKKGTKTGNNGRNGKFNHKRDNGGKSGGYQVRLDAVEISGPVVNSVTGRIYKQVQVNGRIIEMRLDTGADVTLISREKWISLGQPGLSATDLLLRAANQKRIECIGSFVGKVKVDGNEFEATCYVVNHPINLLGCDWLSKCKELWKHLSASVEICETSLFKQGSISLEGGELARKLERTFPDVFRKGLGKCTKAKANLILRDGVTPIFRRSRPVPYGTLTKLEKELDRLVELGVISPTTHSEYAAPVVIVKKKTGEIRLCADFSTGLNENLRDHHHPLPTAEDMFTRLNGGAFFSTVDLAEAYLQIEVEESCKKLLTINTPKGLFTYNRLPFGVKVAPAIFQQIMDSLLAGLDGCAAYLDDIVVTGRNLEEHNRNLWKLFERIKDFGLRVKLEKCAFLKKEVEFLGQIISKEGRRPNKEKVRAIEQMPAPKNVSEVRAILGMITYYGAFIRDLRKLRAPMELLLKKGAKFVWSRDCDKAFRDFKNVLKSDLLLMHYDPGLPIVVAADASQDGIGAVLSHRLPDGGEKAVFHASRVLSKAEQNYAQIEKEALALVFACKKFHRFILGREFTLLTDHRPLLAVFGSKTGIPTYTANRLQRWATMLLGYNFTIEYRKTTEFGQADALSRLILQQQLGEQPEDMVIGGIEAEICGTLQEDLVRLPVNAKEIKEESKKDKVLEKVMECVNTRWPAKVAREDPLWSYFNRKETLSVVEGCLLSLERVVIPSNLRERVLKELHRGHPGSTRMKRLARSFVFWPKVDNDIDQLVRNCSRCVELGRDPRHVPSHPWAAPTKPWERVHVDFAGPINGSSFLVLVDAYSRWPEVHSMPCLAAAATLSKLGAIFARFGNPDIIVSDNGTQFQSQSFKTFCLERGIVHITSPPYHPQSNGLAERFVDIFKRTWLKVKAEEGAEQAVYTMLQTYRCTPGPDGRSPAEIFLGRKIRTELSLLRPTSEPAKSRTDTPGAGRAFQPNDRVFAKEYRGPRNTSWVPGVVVERLGHVMYRVRVGEKVWTRHINQLKPRDAVAPPRSPSPDLWLPALQTEPASADDERPEAAGLPPVPAPEDASDDDASMENPEPGNARAPTPPRAPGRALRDRASLRAPNRLFVTGKGHSYGGEVS